MSAKIHTLTIQDWWCLYFCRHWQSWMLYICKASWMPDVCKNASNRHIHNVCKVYIQWQLGGKPSCFKLKKVFTPKIPKCSEHGSFSQPVQNRIWWIIDLLSTNNWIKGFVMFLISYNLWFPPRKSLFITEPWQYHHSSYH